MMDLIFDWLVFKILFIIRISVAAAKRWMWWNPFAVWAVQAPRQESVQGSPAFALDGKRHTILNRHSMPRSPGNACRRASF